MNHFPNISNDDFAIIQFVTKNYLPNDARVYVFGSRARSAPCKKFSDLDLAIDAGRKLTSREVGYFKDAFGISDLPYRVDILDLNDVQDYFKKIIEPDMVEFPKPPAS